MNLHRLAQACAGTGARIAVMELVMPDPGADFTDAAIDMQMYIGTRGSKRTLGAWRSLFDRCGFALEEQVSLQSCAKILVLRAQAGGHDRAI